MRVALRGLAVLGALWLAGAAAVGQLAAPVRGSVMELRQPDATSPALVAVVVLVCAAVLAGWWLWLVASTLACTVAAMHSAARPPRWLVAPRVVRGLLGVVVGTAAGAVLAPTTPPAAAHPAPDRTLPEALTGLALPDRVGAVRSGGGSAHGRPGAPRPGVALVGPGDSLWSITSELLAHPTRRRVASAWPRLYAANRAVLGSDPDLIRPGTRLAVPASLGSTAPAQGGGRR